MSDDQMFEMIMRSQDEIRDELRTYHHDLMEHIEEDRKLANEVWFVKRAFQVTWAALGMGVAWLGIKNAG
jgi:hypothetical protein